MAPINSALHLNLALAKKHTHTHAHTATRSIGGRRREQGAGIKEEQEASGWKEVKRKSKTEPRRETHLVMRRDTRKQKHLSGVLASLSPEIQKAKKGKRKGKANEILYFPLSR